MPVASQEDVVNDFQLSEPYYVSLSSSHGVVLILNPIYTMKNDFTQVITLEAIVEVNQKNNTFNNYKVVINKDEEDYIYNIYDEKTRLPLQLDSGNYEVTLLGSTDNRRFKTLSKTAFKISLEKFAPFLSSSQTVFFEAEDDVYLLAKLLTKDAETDLEKLEIIHDYLIKNLRYDYKKAEDLEKGYVPVPMVTLEEGKGICYDFAALLGAMLRSVDVPAKLIKGYSAYTPVYHAWNEVYIDDTWWIVDSSTDSIFYDYNVVYQLKKSEKNYLTSKFY
jgi:transglutaminase-like putative cysteine protease